MQLLELTSQMRVVWSEEAERASFPSALQATLRTERECPSRTPMQFPEFTSQMCAVLSEEPERASFPSALQATLHTEPE